MIQPSLFIQMDIPTQLAQNGYATIPNVLTSAEVIQAREMFDKWISQDQILNLHHQVSPYGIFKHFQAAHQEHAWFIRTRPAVQEPFRQLWKTQDLVVSFDSSCWMKGKLAKKNTCWTHTDQAPSKVGPTCYQGLVSLTANRERSLVVYEGSHLLHEKYMKEYNLTHKEDWVKIDPDYLAHISDKRKVIATEPGMLVLWDSRTFHQNQWGNPARDTKGAPIAFSDCVEERIVQYVCFLPRSGCTPAQAKKRQKYFQERRVTSHWPYPVHVNPLQPRSYGPEKIVIDYSTLVPPALEKYEKEIDLIL